MRDKQMLLEKGWGSLFGCSFEQYRVMKREKKTTEVNVIKDNCDSLENNRKKIIIEDNRDIECLTDSLKEKKNHYRIGEMITM